MQKENISNLEEKVFVYGNDILDKLSIRKILEKQTEEDIIELIIESDYLINFDIYERQNIFSDFLSFNDSEILSNLLYDIKQINEKYSLYKEANYGYEVYFNFLFYVKDYLDFIKKIYEMFKSKEFSSKFFNRFIKRSIKIIEETNYNELILDINKALKNYETITSFSYVFNGNHVFMTDKININTVSSKLNLINKSLFKDEEDISTKKIRETKKFTRGNELKELYSNEVDELYEFYLKYKDIYNDSLLEEKTVFTYNTIFNRVFNYYQDLSVPYCKSVINNDDSFVLKDFYNVEILEYTDRIVPNDIVFKGDDRIKMITGVNGGGKSIYVRGVGINYLFFFFTGYVFAKEASLFIVDKLFYHFPNDELYNAGTGRFYDEIKRVNDNIDLFSNKSLLLFNEAFSSTNDEKGLFAFNEAFEKIKEKKSNLIFVTHNVKIVEKVREDNILVYTPEIISLEKNIRTYKISLAKNYLPYTIDILYKHKLTKEQLEEREIRKQQEDRKKNEHNEEL